MTGICGYVPTQTLSNWCVNVDPTGSGVGVALSVIVILILAKLQSNNANKEQLIQPLHGRVQFEDHAQLVAEAGKLSEFLSDAFINPDSNQTIARGFIKNPQAVVGQAKNPVRTLELWKLLLRMTLSTFIREQFEPSDSPSSQGVRFGEPNQEIYVDFMGLLEKINDGPGEFWIELREFGKGGKLEIVSGFLKEMANLQVFLNGLNGENFYERAQQIYPADLVSDLHDYLIRNDLEKGKEELVGAPKHAVLTDVDFERQEGPARQPVPDMIPVE